MSAKMSRREMLRSLGLAGAGGLLAACQPKTVIVEKEKEVTKIVKETVEVAAASSGPTDVKIIVSGWVDTAWQVSKRANEYNAEQEDVRISIIPIPEGWTTKAMSQIEAGAPVWDGYATHHPFRISVQWLAQGLIMPIDDFLDANTIVNMDEFWADAVDPEKIKFDCSVKGKVVGVPLGIDTCCQAFRADLMEAADLPHTREDLMKEATWDHMQQWAEIIRDKNKADGVWGIGTWQVYHQSLGAIYQSIATDLYDDQGLIKFDSEEMIRAFEIQAKWSWTEVAPTPAWGSEPFIKGLAGLWQGQVGVVGTAQRVWGKQGIPVPMPVLVEPTGTGGNQWYTTCGFVLNKAEHPQEVTDFYLWMFGPQNDLNAKLTLDFNWFPVFQSQWDKQVEGNPDREWAKDFLPQLKEAELVPRNPYYEIQVAASRKYCELCQAQKVTPKEAGQQCMEEVRKGVSELKIEW